MRKHLLFVSILLVSIIVFISGCASSPGSSLSGIPEIKGPYYEAAHSGAGITLSISQPEGRNLKSRDIYLLDMIQGSLTENFRDFSAITLISRRDQSAEVHGTDAYILNGSLIATSEREFSLSLTITDTGSGEVAAQYQKTAITVQDIRRDVLKAAAMQLLEGMGVRLTRNGIALLEAQARTDAQEKLAKSRAAERAGNRLEGLINAYSAQALNPKLPEAEDQLKAAGQAMSGGGPESEHLNDSQRQSAWREQLAEFEKYYREHHPFEIWYTSIPEHKATDYTTGTADFEFTIGLFPSRDFSAMQNVLKFLSDLLDKTRNRKKWGLASWPQEPVEYDLYKLYRISVVAGLFDENGVEISRVRVNDLYSQLYYRNKSIYYDSTPKMLVSIPRVDVNKLTPDMRIRIISIDYNGAGAVNADDAEADGYWYINPVSTRQFPAGSPATIPERMQLIPQPEPDSSLPAADPKESKEPRQRRFKALKNRFGLSFSGLVGANTFADGSSGDFLDKLSLAGTLEVGIGPLNIEGIVHLPVKSETITISSLGLGLGYSFITRHLLSTISLGFTYTQIFEKDNSATVPFIQAKFDIMPWETGLGLRLGFMAEAASLDWGDPYTRYFSNSLSLSDSWRLNGKIMAGLVLWF